MGKKRNRITSFGARRNDDPVEPDVPRFDNFKNLAYAGIFVVFGAVISLNDFQKMWVLPSSPTEMTLFAARVILFGEFVVLVLLSGDKDLS